MNNIVLLDDNQELPFGAPIEIDPSQCGSYYKVLQQLHERLLPRTYLEVGVLQGNSLAMVLPTTRCIGVDPIVRDRNIPNNCQMFHLTSDRFFCEQHIKSLLGGLSLDLAFLDGMHLFEFVLRDFINTEKYCTKTSSIILHDCLPVNAVTSERQRTTQFWTGDVWKIIPVLRQYRPELTLDFFDVLPSGLVLARGLDPKNTVLKDCMPEILKKYLNQTYADYQKNSPVKFITLEDITLSKSELYIRKLFHITESVKLKFRIKRKKSSNISLRKEELPEAQKLDNVALRLPRPPLGCPRQRMLGVLLCYNDADILPDAIEAMLKNNHDLIVWNHGSTDNTQEILDKYSHFIKEIHFLPREFDFYNLYPHVSRYLIDNCITQYDWISWPDQDEILEGPDRKRSYIDYVAEVMDSPHSYVLFENFTFWFTNEDDESIVSPVDRIRRYCIFPPSVYPPLVRAWKAKNTNIRWFNHNPIEGSAFPQSFRLRHYPMRSYDKSIRRIIFDRDGIQRDNLNVHYNNMMRKLDRIVIDKDYLHFDNHIYELKSEVTFKWEELYF